MFDFQDEEGLASEILQSIGFLKDSDTLVVQKASNNRKVVSFSDKCVSYHLFTQHE